MSKIISNKKCLTRPNHTPSLMNRRNIPIVLSAKRFDEILSRATRAEQEQHRYMEYLRDGNEYICGIFKPFAPVSIDEQKQAKLELEEKEAVIRKRQVSLEDEQLRNERVYRAKITLENMKPAQRSLNRARLQSEVIFQRQLNDKLNLRIAYDAQVQQKLDDERCGATCIPYCALTEQEQKREKRAKALKYGKELAKDIEETRLRKLDEKKQQDADFTGKQAQYQCMQELEQKAAKERDAKSRQFLRCAYQDALKEKAQLAKYNESCQDIEDRTIFFNNEMRHQLTTDSAKCIKKQLADRILQREQVAFEVSQHQTAARRLALASILQDQFMERYDNDLFIDATTRQSRLEKLAKERRAYELEERKQLELRRQQLAEIRRFQIAERLKNQQINQQIEVCRKAKKQEDATELRRMLCDQHDEFRARRQQEQLRLSSCQADPHLADDVKFFNDALDAMTAAQKTGRPMKPIAKAVETYRRQNHIGVPESQVLTRSNIRDYCWPGYYSKAELAFKNYQHRKECLDEQQHDRAQILENCIKITKMAAEELPMLQQIPCESCNESLSITDGTPSSTHGNYLLKSSNMEAHNNGQINLKNSAQGSSTVRFAELDNGDVRNSNSSSSTERCLSIYDLR